MSGRRPYHPAKVGGHPIVVDPNRKPTAAEVYRRIRERAKAPRQPPRRKPEED